MLDQEMVILTGSTHWLFPGLSAASRGLGVQLESLLVSTRGPRAPKAFHQVSTTATPPAEEGREARLKPAETATKWTSC